MVMDENEIRRRRAARNRVKRIRKRRNQQALIRLAVVVAILGLVFFAGYRVGKSQSGDDGQTVAAQAKTAVKTKVVEDALDFDVQLLTPNEYSRPQDSLLQVRGIVVHYTANPGTTAQQNHDYFEGLKDGGNTSASSHFIIGIEGEIIQCIPTSEIAYASNERNEDTISIECCHLDETGEFTKKTYDSLVHLVAWLCGKFGLTPEDVIRHYDVSGKRCPLYYVEHEEAWEKFIDDVGLYIERHGTLQ